MIRLEGALRRAREDDGMTTVGMAIALLLTFSLVLSTAQVYRVLSASAEIQEVADAAALAAQNEVAEYMVAVRVCDALVLSMNLLGSSLYGAGVAAACVPAAQGLSASLTSMGKQVFAARDSFSQRAIAGLNQLQRALPFLAAAKAASLAVAQEGALGTSYLAVAVLVPAEGKEIQALGDAGSAEVAQKTEEAEEELQEAARAAEEAAQAAHEAKERAFMADCGAAPGYCMYERASRLAGLAGAANPRYESVDTWSFAVPIERARAYYAARLAREAPASSSLADQANSALRRQFYAFSVEQLEGAYVRDTQDSFDAHFPVLPANAEQVRASALYGRALFPVTAAQEGATLHAWPGCPGAAGASGLSSLAQMEAAGWAPCAQCGFDVAMMGNVAAASTSVENGFEHHYRDVALAAAEYEAARAELDPVSEEVKSLAGGLVDSIGEVLGNAKESRIKAEPPGAKGCVAFVVGGSSMPVDEGLATSFVQGQRTLGTRVAVSAATLVEDPSGEGRSVITSLLDGFAADGIAVGLAGLALDAWSALLSAYASGQSALADAIEGLLGGIPLDSQSNLGTWAADKVTESFAAVGLQEPDLDALKPVLVNSGVVTAAGGDGFSARYVSLKEGALGVSGPSPSLFSSILNGVEADFAERIEDLEEGFEIARVELGFAGISIPLEIALPHAAGVGAMGVVEGALDAVRQAYFEIVDMRVWQ